MHWISTGGERLRTTDVVADAVLDYAAALVRAQLTEVVGIPILREDGTLDRARLLLTPATQLTLLPDAGPEVALPDDASLVAELAANTELLEPTVRRPAVAAVSEVFPDFGAYA